MIVELMSTETPDGVTLDGTLRTPAAGAASDLPVDIFIMHHGVGGAFYRASFFEDMAEALLARGCAVLRANNRGHDLAYNTRTPLGRLGAAFETLDHCRLDWTAWIDFATARGFGRIGVWGHSLGAVKTIYALARDDDKRIARAIASSPPRFSHSAYLARPDGALFAASVEKAQRLLDAGDTATAFPIDIPTSALMSARTFFEKYGADERYDILKLLPEVRRPLLVTVGALEGREGQPDRFAFGGLAARLDDLARTSGTFAFDEIADADHYYAGVTDRLWAAVDGWLSG